MTLRKVIKKNAKAALRGNYGKAILILLIVLAAACLLGALSGGIFALLGFRQGDLARMLEELLNGPMDSQTLLDAFRGAVPQLICTCISTLAELLVLLPLSLGVTNWYLEKTDGKQCGVGEIFWPFGCSAFWRGIWLQICVFFRMWLLSLLVIGVPTAGLTFAVFYLQEYVSLNAAAAVTTFLGVLVLVLTLLLVVFSLRYAIAPLLICRKYHLPVGKAIRASVRYTKGHRWEIFGVMLSFLPWFLLCVFLFPAFFVLPYYTMTMVMYLRYLYEDGLNRDGLLDTSEPDAIILDDLAPEAVSGPRRGDAAAKDPQEQFYYPPQAWGAPAQPEQPEQPERPDDGYAEL